MNPNLPISSDTMIPGTVGPKLCFIEPSKMPIDEQLLNLEAMLKIKRVETLLKARRAKKSATSRRDTL